MVVAEKNKKNAAGQRRVKAAKKEIDIPVVILGGRPGENVQTAKSEEVAKSDFKIVADKDDLPVFSSQGGSASGEENRVSKIERPFLSTERPMPVEEKKVAVKVDGSGAIPADDLKNGEEKKNPLLRAERKSPMAVGEKRDKKLGLLADPKRKEAVMMVSVVLIASLIFFAWLVILRNNLSFSLGPQNPFSVSNGGQTLTNLRDGWADISTQLSNFDSALEQQRAAESVNQEVVNKLKEKLLNGAAAAEEPVNVGAEAPGTETQK